MSQIKKKFIANDAIDGTKIKLLNGESLRIEDGQGGEIELLKLQDGKAFGPQGAFATQTDIDAAIAAVVDSAPAVLDTLRELADALGNDPDFSASILEKIGDIQAKNAEQDDRLSAIESKNFAQDGRLDANEATLADHTSRITSAEARLDSNEELLAVYADKISLNCNDIENIIAKNAEQDDRLTSVESKNSEQDSRLSSLESKSDDQDFRLTTLEDNNSEQDGRLTSLESSRDESNSRLSSLESTSSEHSTKLSDLESDLSDLNTKVDSFEADADSRLNALESGVKKSYKNRFQASESDLSYIEIPHKIDADSLMVTVDRLVAFSDYDYTLSEVGNKTRITWIGELGEGGVSQLAVGDYIGYQYMSTSTPNS